MNDVLKRITPAPLSRDRAVQDIIKAIDRELNAVDRATGDVLLLPRLEELPVSMLDELAWQYHVDFYDDMADKEEKVTLIRNAIAWHRIKGTPAAVERVCSAVFKTAKVFEWFEYEGKPYHFQVRLIEEAVPDKRVIDSLMRAIMVTKNTRSWLDGLSFYRKVDAKIYVGALLLNKKTVDIYPLKFVPHDAEGRKYYGAGTYYHRKVEIS